MSTTESSTPEPASEATAAEETASRVLVVEDEEAIAQGLVYNLRRKGYQVDLAGDGESALELARGDSYDLIVLDVRLPKADGFEVCQRLRREGNFAAVLMLTARDQPDDIVYGLKSGADDYMVKPFDLAEFLARVEGLLRRARWLANGSPAGAENGAIAEDGGDPEASRLTFGDFWVDFRTWRAATLDGVRELSRKEIAVMQVFAEKPNEVVPRRELLDR
ncbi:MAG: response regulator transcription factor, partial [Thermoanaerobaculia bacterium]